MTLIDFSDLTRQFVTFTSFGLLLGIMSMILGIGISSGLSLLSLISKY